MDETWIHVERAGQALQRPHKTFALPRGFVPLRLHVLPGERRITVAEPTCLIGRHSGADLRLLHADVSRRHCRLTFQRGGWRVADLGSLNGVYLNDTRILEGPLRDGDRLGIGPVKLLVKVSAVPDPKVEVLKSIADALPRKVA